MYQGLIDPIVFTNVPMLEFVSLYFSDLKLSCVIIVNVLSKTNEELQ
jgi:hypothetical protein